MTLNPIILETDRLTLQGYSPAELIYLFESCGKDDIMKKLGHRTEEDYQQEFYKYTNGYTTYNRSFILFLLIETGTGTIMGRCALHNWNKEHKRAEIGYDISDLTYRQKGFMTEAVKAIISYGFTTLRLHRIEALVGSQNIPSLKIMEKNQFRKEGLLRQHYYSSGRYDGTIVFSKLDMKLLRWSHLFKFEGEKIEYALGLIVEEKRIIISYSKWDREPAIGIYDKFKVEMEMF